MGTRALLRRLGWHRNPLRRGSDRAEAWLNAVLLIALLLAGSLSLVTATTLIAAIIARASAKGALFAVLSFPILVPQLVVAIQGTALALDGEGWRIGLAPLQVLFAYTLALFVASLFLFRFVWEP